MRKSCVDSGSDRHCGVSRSSSIWNGHCNMLGEVCAE